jgi:lipoprotein-anchoring transpeptidase ErfK/SrfK
MPDPDSLKVTGFFHGTNQPNTIGSAVSSGCIRLVNPDVMDLYNRVPVGTKVIVQQKPKV